MSTLLRGDDAVLKIHTASDGAIWFLDGKRSPASAGVGVVDQCIDPHVLRGKAVRVLGVAANARLLMSLFQQQRAGLIGGIQIAGPRAVCESKAERDDPQQLLFRMRQCALPGSLGGWHTMTSADYTLYAMVHQLAIDGRVTDHVRQLFRSHPAASDLCFIDSLAEDAAAELMVTVIDPRFFIDRESPNRVAKLKKFLGLSPRVQQDVHEGVMPSASHARCQLVQSCWAATPPTTLTPRSFLHRIFWAERNPAKAMVKASQAFVTFLHYTWLSRVTLATTSGGEGSLFDPGLFFRRDDEVAAYRAYAAAN